MLKAVIALLILILLSLAIVFFMPASQQVVGWIVSAHDWVADVLKDVFAGGGAGDTTRKLLALITVPFAISFIPVIIYWLLKRSWFPYFVQLVWIIWLIQTAALVIAFKTGT